MLIWWLFWQSLILSLLLLIVFLSYRSQAWQVHLDRDMQRMRTVLQIMAATWPDAVARARMTSILDGPGRS